MEEQARLCERVADLTDTQFKQIHDQLDSIRKVNEEMSAVNETMLMQIDRNHHNIVALQSLKQELDDFKEAACPRASISPHRRGYKGETQLRLQPALRIGRKTHK